MKGRTGYSLTVVLLAAVPLAAQQATFSTRTDAVRVDVSVTERGLVVRGLRSEDFEVRDNGVLQQVDLTSFEQLPLNVVLALDLSGSVGEERLNDLKSASTALLDGLVAKDKVALLTFNHAVTLREALTSDAGRLRVALDAARPAGETALYDATFAALSLGAGDPGRDLMLIFSDSRDTASWLSSERVLQSARRSDVVVFGLSLRGSGSARFLRELSGETGGETFELDTTRNLKARFLGILDGFRQRYLVSYSPRGVARGSWHRLEVRVKGRSATVRARPGYFDR